MLTFQPYVGGLLVHVHCSQMDHIVKRCVDPLKLLVQDSDKQLKRKVGVLESEALKAEESYSKVEEQLLACKVNNSKLAADKDELIKKHKKELSLQVTYLAHCI